MDAKLDDLMNMKSLVTVAEAYGFEATAKAFHAVFEAELGPRNTPAPARAAPKASAQVVAFPRPKLWAQEVPQTQVPAWPQAAARPALAQNQ